MALPDKNRSLSRYMTIPVIDANGTQIRTVSFYKAAYIDAAATVSAAGFFNFARGYLQVNDMIEVMTVANGTGDVLNLKVTAVPASGDVTVAVNSEAAGS